MRHNIPQWPVLVLHL